MMNLCFILFLLTSCVAAVKKYDTTTGVQPPLWSNMPWAVPASEKDGHSWMISIADKKPVREGQPASPPVTTHSGIAVALINNEVIFARYNPLLDEDQKKTDCVNFHTPRGSQTICDNQFFLLHENFGKFIRVPATKDKATNPCPPNTYPVEFRDFRIILDKPSSQEESSKYIGTHFLYRDEVSYFRLSDSPEHISRFSASSQLLNTPTRFETLCRQEHTKKGITKNAKL